MAARWLEWLMWDMSYLLKYLLAVAHHHDDTSIYSRTENAKKTMKEEYCSCLNIGNPLEQ